jgi:hypothetical protein
MNCVVPDPTEDFEGTSHEQNSCISGTVTYSMNCVVPDPTEDFEGTSHERKI